MKSSGFYAPMRVRFMIDPTVALELFSDRAKSMQEVRKSALLHWVKNHLRRKRSDANEFTEVRRHIRGKTSFQWHGFDCTIEPDADYLNSIKA